MIRVIIQSVISLGVKVVRCNCLNSLFHISLVLALSATTSNTFADVQGPIVVLGPNVPKQTRTIDNWTKWKASRFDLRGSQFVGIDFSNSSFDNCDLDGVRFVQCNMARCSFQNANFRGAELSEVDFEDADFSGARINGIKRRDRTGVLCLTDRQIKSTWSYRNRDMAHCIISRYQFVDQPDFQPRLDLSGIDLSNSAFEVGDFSMCDFQNAEILNVLFYQAKVDVEQLESTKTFQRKSLYGVQFSRDEVDGKLSLVGCDIRNCRLYIQPKTDMHNARIEGAELHRLSFEQLKTTASYKLGLIPNAVFTRSDFSGGDFTGINLTGCRFLSCDFSNAKFDDAVISGVEIASKTRGLTKEQVQSTWNAKHNRLDTATLPKELANGD